MRAARGLTILGLALVMMGHTPGAWACSCLETTTARTFKSADVVFVGTAQASEDSNTGSVQSSDDPILWTFGVQSVQKGTARSVVQVTSARGDSSCGFEFTIGKRYQVFAEQTSTGLTTGICSGTVALTAGAKPFSVQSSRLAHTGRSDGFIVVPIIGLLLVVAGAIVADEAHKRSFFTWPR
jgi:hypothetical protein